MSKLHRIGTKIDTSTYSNAKKNCLLKPKFYFSRLEYIARHAA